MMKFRHALLLLAALFTLAACNDDKDIPEPPRPETAPQTLLVYFSGRGNLVSAFDRNIANMLKAIDKNTLGYGRVLVFRQTGTSTSTISELRYDWRSRKAVQEVLKTYEDALVSIEEPTMTRILNDMIALSPSEKYGLLMGSHATGWVLSTDLTKSVLGAYAPDDYWKKSDGEPLTRGFGYDDSRTMDIPALAEALAATGRKFEYLIFDACFMSSIEALYDLRNIADRIVATPCEVMLYGHPYDQSLPSLFTNGGGEYDLQAFCEGFYNFYATTTLTRQSGCIALAECAELDELAGIVRRIHAAGTKSYNRDALQIYEGLTPHLFYDFGDFIEASCGDAALLTEFQTCFDRAFPTACRLHTPEFYTDYGRMQLPVTRYSGVSVSEPSLKYTAENKQTNWYKATHE